MTTQALIRRAATVSLARLLSANVAVRPQQRKTNIMKRIMLNTVVLISSVASQLSSVYSSRKRLTGVSRLTCVSWVSQWRAHSSLPGFFITVLTAWLALETLCLAQDKLEIGPAAALPDYTKTGLAAGTSFADEIYPIFCLGDFNGDGRLDVAILTGVRPPVPPYKLRVYLQTTNGTLQANGEYQLPNTGRTPTFLSEDFNSDGYLDLLLEDQGHDLIMLFGNGDGTFQEPHFLGLSAPALPVAAHFNGDRHIDLVSGALDGTRAIVFTNAGDGTFALSAFLSTVIEPFLPERGKIMVADLNHDGYRDVAVASVRNDPNSIGNLDVFLSNGDGSFQGKISTPNVAVRRGALGDFNGDGILDFAGDSYTLQRVEIWLGQGDGHFQAGRSYAISDYNPVEIQVGDLNGDGILDLAVSGEASGHAGAPLGIFLGNGDGTFQPRQLFTPLPGADVYNVGARLRDFNRDGPLDIVSVGGYPGTEQPNFLAVALNRGMTNNPSLGFLLKVNPAPGGVGPLVLEASTNLVAWTALSTNATPIGPWPIVDTAAALQQRYYRTRRESPALSITEQPKP